MSSELLEVPTAHGLARAHLHAAPDARALLVLGHGAGGGIAAADLGVVSAAALAEGVSVALTEQPYRVAGRRSPAPAPQLDVAFTTVVAELRAAGRVGEGIPLFTGGRSSGARVACRTAVATGAAGIVCLAFPLLAPRRRDGTRPSRLDELDAVAVPVLIVQGTNDPFGMPPDAPGRTIVQVAGDHSLRKEHAAIKAAARAWLADQLG